MRTRTYVLAGAGLGCAVVTAFALGTPANAGLPGVVQFALALVLGGLMMGAPVGALLGTGVVWLVNRRQGAETAARPAPARVATPARVTAPTTPAARSAPNPPPAPKPEKPRPTITPEQRAQVLDAAKRQGQRDGHMPPAPLAPVKPAPERPARATVDLSDPTRVNRVLDRIDAMPGMEEVGRQVRSMANRIIVDERRKRRGLPVVPAEMHMVITGPRGTGKTTLAGTWGDLLAALGLLPSGHIHKVTAENLIAGFEGQSATKTKEQIAEARGGVLFVDEAYALTRKGQGQSSPFGDEVIATLLEAMEAERGEFCTILAGYPDDMERLLDSNEGLRSRVSRTLTLDDYDAPTCLAIFDSMAAEAQMALTDAARDLLTKAVTRMAAARRKDWGNARSMRHLLDAMIEAQADRLAVLDETDPDYATQEVTLTDEDVRAALQRKHPWVLE